MTDLSWLPHRFCVNNNTWWIRLNVIGNLGILLAYYGIPLTLIKLVNVKAIGSVIGRGTFFLFATFIFLCGTTHLMDVVVLWDPTYWLQTIIILVTAIISLITLAQLIPIVIVVTSRDGGEKRYDAHRLIEDSTVPQLEEFLRSKGVKID